VARKTTLFNKLKSSKIVRVILKYYSAVPDSSSTTAKYRSLTL